MMNDKRAMPRVSFERGIPVRILAIDATWQRECEMLDVSQSGALLRILGDFSNIELKEFFLVLSSVGSAHRRCELAWVDGDRIGANFIRAVANSKSRPRAG